MACGRKTVGYSELDPYASQWLRNLVDAEELPFGEVYEGDFRDIRTGLFSDHKDFHFFAGIGIFPKALKDLGVAYDESIWTGSCPCQPFSQAGKGLGFADERHLWPYWLFSIQVAQPSLIFGEQVAGKDGEKWFDLVSDDLTANDYEVGSAILPAFGFGAPHKRERRFFGAIHRGASRAWVVNTDSERSKRRGGYGELHDSERRETTKRRSPAPVLHSCESE